MKTLITCLITYFCFTSIGYSQIDEFIKVFKKPDKYEQIKLYDSTKFYNSTKFLHLPQNWSAQIFNTIIEFEINRENDANSLKITGIKAWDVYSKDELYPTIKEIFPNAKEFEFAKHNFLIHTNKDNDQLIELYFHIDESDAFENRWVWHFFTNLRNVKDLNYFITEFKFILLQIITEYDFQSEIENKSNSDNTTLTPEELQKKGFDFLIKNEYDSALYFFNKCLDLDPDNLIALNSKAQIFVKQQKNKKAISTIEQILSIQPEFSESWSLLGMLNFVDGDSIKAENNFNQAIRVINNRLNIETDSVAIESLKLNRAFTYILLNETTKAHKDLKDLENSGVSKRLINDLYTKTREDLIYEIIKPETAEEPND